METYERKVLYMILTTILLLTLIMLVVFTILIVSATGAVGIVLFSDVIVCIMVMVWIIKHLFKRKKK